MSFREVTELRKAGRLDEALRMARQDLQEEKSEWTYSALFWVLRDYCKAYLSQDKDDDALTMLHQMEAIVGYMDDDEGYAQDAISKLRQQMTPCWDEVNGLTEQSKNGQEEQAYEGICELHRAHPLSDNLHEAFGWIIYRFLKKCFQSCGSLKARKALHTYLKLNNERPSLLHSQMLNVATLVSEQYADFKFLPFLEIWDVNTLSDEDFYSSTWNEKEFSPLVERIIERCFRLGYGLEETRAAFTKNERISDDLVESLFSKIQFYTIYKSKSEGAKALFAHVERYVSVIDGLPISNEYHSRILSLYLWSIPDEDIADAIPVIDKWGLGNLRDEDWQRESDDDGKEFPSLVEMIAKHYFAGLKAIRFRSINDQYEQLLRKACKKYDDDQLDRNLAILLMAKGNREEALSVYRSLLLTLNQYYVWKELAEVTDDEELKISAYCKAILAQTDDKFLGDVHLGLAELMIGKKMYGEAKRELQTYAGTYDHNRWGKTGEYYTLLSQIPDGTVATDSNVSFYQSHLSSAEDFVYSDIEWTTMFVVDVFVHKKKHEKMVKLVSSEGLGISIKYKRLGAAHDKNMIGSCFDVKIHSGNGKNEIVLIKESAVQLDKLLEPVVCYVDYHNRQKKIYHLVSEKGKALVMSNPSTPLKEGSFCRCYAIPDSNKPTSDSVRLPKALFHSLIDPSLAMSRFPTKIGVVDNVNESKSLFHCVFGHNDDIIIKYNQTSLRPKAGDYLSICYCLKRNNEGKRFRKMIDVKVAGDCERKLTRTAVGKIRINYNAKGLPFGFVEDYYVPGFLLNGIDDDDEVIVNVVFDGERWKAYSVEKANE